MPEKPIEIITSFGALVRDDMHRREVKFPKESDLPRNIPKIYDAKYGHIPAVIGVTGRLAAIREFSTRRVAQWQLYCTPTHAHVRDRLSRPDLLDIINDVHTELTRSTPPRGAMYTAYFSIPGTKLGPVDSENFFDWSHSSTAGLVRDQELELRRSWNPYRHFCHIMGYDLIRDPWNEDKGVEKKIDRVICLKLKPVLMLVWRSWSKEADVCPMLKMQGVPVEDDSRTVYRPDNVDKRILDRLPPAMRHTLFAGAIPDLEDDEDPYIVRLQRH